MTTTYIQLGTNMGDRLQNLSIATKLICKSCGLFVAASSVYQTAAWGLTNQADFLNQVLLVKTPLTPSELLDNVLRIELDMGRIRTEKYGSRTIDLDILFYGNQIINLPNLTIPHPHIANRRFVLTPLAEITPNKIHPVYRKPIKQLLEQCTDLLQVEKF